MENFKFFEQNRLNYSMKLYNVLHGNSLDQMKAWYKEASKFQFDGWALGVKPTDNIYLQTIGYLYLKEKDAINHTSFHMFGMSSIKNMITNAMLADRFGHTITYDSSSYDSGARFRKFMFPKSVKYSMDFGRAAKKTLESIPCKCPVCRNITISDLYADSDKGYMLLPLHNLYQYIEVNRMINCIVTDELALTKYCKSVGENKTRSIISHMLNDYDNMSVSKLYDKYKHLMVIGQELPHQGNINSY
jgi:queuine/archaeosine tRNA-ribosyltransferase